MRRTMACPDALFFKGLYLHGAHDYLEAARAWEHFLDIAPAAADRGSLVLLLEEAFAREFPDWLLYKGVALFERGDFQGAERVWTRYLDLAPDGPARESVRALIEKAREKGSVAG